MWNCLGQTYACNNLTSFWNAAHAITRNGNYTNLLKSILEEFVKAHQVNLFLAGFSHLKPLCSGSEVQPENPCFLVGFNLREACSNLEDRCVLLRECSQFNESCTKCQVRTKLVFVWIFTRRTHFLVVSHNCSNFLSINLFKINSVHFLI